MTTSGPVTLVDDAVETPASGASQARAVQTVHAVRAVQVVFLTGQSDPARCALSPAQRAFLESLPLPAPAPDRPALNFPYHADTLPWRSVSLLAASVNNARQYLASRQPDFAARHAPHVQRLLSRAPRTLILAGSAGLELLANLRLPREALDRVHVFAYGPVARHLPDCTCVFVQGRRDWISRLWFSEVDHRVECTHLDYLESPEVLALCVQTLHKMTLREPTPRESTLRGAS